LGAHFRRHNAGQNPATKHGVPWILVYFEKFETRTEAVRRERYFKTGRGREELEKFRNMHKAINISGEVSAASSQQA
jgi:putative endonuclease